MARTTKDYSAITDGIIAAAGGESNITSVSHCMTRLRLTLRDASRVNADEARAIHGVLSYIKQDGEEQFVIGQDVPEVYRLITVEGVAAR